MLITDLPNEIQSRIFAEIYWEERELEPGAQSREFGAYWNPEEPPSSPPIFYEHDTQWIEPWPHGDLRSVQNSFPNSIASVCRQWRSIMASTSRFWSRFILDLDDPICLPLDVFTWSGPRALDVLIQSRPQETLEDAKELEHSRVLTAFKGLTPYISSCKSIIFDVKYASSLPLPAPFLTSEHRHLKTLKMEFQINDMVLPLSLNIPPSITFAEKFSNFQNLSLHGAIFMEFSRADPTWSGQKSKPNGYTTLMLLNLECSAGDYPSYKVAELVEYLSRSTTLSRLVFKHIRFAGQHGPQDIPDNQIFEDAGSLTFEDVDPGFIYAFLPSTTSSFLESITFKNCRISRMLESRTMNLNLTDIPDRSSLKNMLRHHNGPSIAFTSCPGFDDNLLNYLATHLRVPELRSLQIYECDQFTVAGLRAFLEARKDGTPDLSDEQIDPDEEVGAITHLSVHWTGLRLTDEDKAWFGEYFGDGSHISWRERGHTFIHPRFNL